VQRKKEGEIHQKHHLKKDSTLPLILVLSWHLTTWWDHDGVMGTPTNQPIVSTNQTMVPDFP
jgi:hypothetical protein